MTKRKASKEESALMRRVFKDVDPLDPHTKKYQHLDKTVEAEKGSLEKLLSEPRPALKPQKSPLEIAIEKEQAEQKRLRQQKLAKLLLKGVGRTKTFRAQHSHKHTVSHGKQRTPNFDLRSDERLRRGQYEIDATIDLHGMGLADAHQAFTTFILQAAKQDLRQILAITGKGSKRLGTGVIRQSLPNWVNEPTLKQVIIAIRHAQPKDGGDGAFYIRLRRRRSK